jgi:hypothetical protein
MARLFGLPRAEVEAVTRALARTGAVRIDVAAPGLGEDLVVHRRVLG